jgi:ferredoxin-NADP reductase/Na+-translocating ferredoxin:NAD+ oxidoreductase RnfD subunit
MTAIDRFLNKITMYRLLTYVLCGYTGIVLVYSLFGKTPAEPTKLVASLLILLFATYVTDRIFAFVFKVPANAESWLITALILFLIIAPINSPATIIALGLAGGTAIASKYLISFNGRHIFNPAAFAAAFMSLWGVLPTTWWIGSSLFWPYTLIGGLLIVRKIRHGVLVTAFVATAIILELQQIHGALGANLIHFLVASPLIFLATIMLTEPATMPPTRNLQVVFSVLIGVLYVSNLAFGPLIVLPEVAILFGNLYAWIVSPKSSHRLKLRSIQKVGGNVYNYVFTPDRPIRFLPGQYMQWTLPGVPFDSRGNRRSFTIASSPTESTVQLGIKFYEPASQFKATMAQMRPGATIYASQLAGSFTLAGRSGAKFAFIAGGVGITPFRSMVKYLTDTNTKSNIIVLYAVSNPAELAYMTDFQAAARVGVKIVPIVTKPGNYPPGIVAARLDAGTIARLIPDHADRHFYVSGPDAMVDATIHYLSTLGVSRPRIHTDHFSGY